MVIQMLSIHYNDTFSFECKTKFNIYVYLLKIKNVLFLDTELLFRKILDIRIFCL